MSSEFIPFNKPALGEEEIRSVVETLRSCWLTTGPKVKTFEAEFARYIGSSHAVAVNSATAALHLAIEAVGIKSGDEVLVPVAYGYESHLGRRIPWPVRSFIVAVDLATGKGLRNVVELADDSTGITAVLPDGSILSSLGAGITSSVAPMSGVARWLLPDDLELLAPVGGLQISRPEHLLRPH